MKKIFSFFTQRWVVTLIGVIALSLVVWFFGPFISIAGTEPFGPVLNRLITINIIFVLWVIIRMWSFYRAKRQNTEVIAGMVAAPEAEVEEEAGVSASDEELETLRERFSQALAKLKETRLGGASGRRFLYQLPWYVIIGPPGSGKTTLLKNSDLKFPLAESNGESAIRGVGGTRNCDWWFAEDAVLLDTAGRYTTQDSNENVDKSAWLGFLDLLKKYRSRRPINGVLIAVSISDLLEFNAEQRKAHAHTIRSRIHELYENLGIQAPVYLMFTKCDLLAGFMEYFDDINRDERAQVWGTTFPFNEQEMGSTIQQYESEFELLLQHLEQQLLSKLQHESNDERRDLIYAFPQQFNEIKQLLFGFISEIFHATRYQQPVMIRGVYFTSATQEGTPIDRIMSSVAGSFGLDRQALVGTSKRGKSFFINHLLRRVVFAEAGLAGTNLKLEHRRMWLQRAVFASILAATLVVSAVWLYSYNSNLNYISEVKTQAQELQLLADELDPDQQDLLTTLPMLDMARNLPGGYADQLESRPWSMTFGLYQGDKLGEAAKFTYHRLLKTTFLPRLMTRLEQQLADNGNNPEYLFGALKAYLMLDDGKHFDSNQALAWITKDVEDNLPIKTTNIEIEALNEHLQTTLSSRPVPLPRPLNAALVNDARLVLADQPMAKRAYGRLKRELIHSDIPDFRITDAAGIDASVVFVRKSGVAINEGIPGLFTYDGYYKLFLPKSEQLTKSLADESWVLGSSYHVKPEEEALETLRNDVLALYLEDYKDQWQALIDDIQVAPFSNLEEAVAILNILSDSQSPLKALLVAVEQETALHIPPEEEASGLMGKLSKLKKAKRKLDTTASRAGVRSRYASGLVSSIRLPSSVHNVSYKFNRLHALVRSKDDNTPAPINKTLSLLNELYIYLNALVNISAEELVLREQKQVAQVLQKVKTEAKRQPSLINEMLTSVANNTSSLVGGGVCQHINATWRTEVADFCASAINGRYPIEKDGDLDITEEDFGLFFGPRGKVEAFFNKYLAASVEKKRNRWRWIKREGSPVCVSSSALQQFRNADIIKKTFFRSGTQAPSVGFSLKPVAMSSEITHLSLDIDGQRLSYAHGPIRSTSMRWPSPNRTGYVSLHISPAISGSSSGYVFEGPWALFHLFDQADLHRLGSSEQFILTFTLYGREIKLELRANSAVNPFSLKELQDFVCMPNL